LYLNESAAKRDQLRCLLSIGPADILHISDKRKFVKLGPRRMGHASGDLTKENGVEDTGDRSEKPSFERRIYTKTSLGNACWMYVAER
jgi:hypothetical protein